MNSHKQPSPADLHAEIRSIALLPRGPILQRAVERLIETAQLDSGHLVALAREQAVRQTPGALLAMKRYARAREFAASQAAAEADERAWKYTLEIILAGTGLM